MANTFCIWLHIKLTIKFNCFLIFLSVVGEKWLDRLQRIRFVKFFITAIIKFICGVFLLSLFFWQDVPSCFNKYDNYYITNFAVKSYLYLWHL